MEYKKATGIVLNFEDEDVTVTSGQDCGFAQYDADYCDGVTQAVSKGQFGQ